MGRVELEVEGRVVEEGAGGIAGELDLDREGPAEEEERSPAVVRRRLVVRRVEEALRVSCRQVAW